MSNCGGGALFRVCSVQSVHWCFKKFHPKVRNYEEGPY